MKTISKIAMGIMIIIFAVSCTKSASTTGISISIKGITSPAVKKSTTVTGFTFTEALLGIKQIELKRQEEKLHDSTTVRDTLKHRFSFNNRYLVDLLAGTSTPSLGFNDFTPGVYNKFESETARTVTGGKTISLKGSYTSSTASVYKFDFSSKAEFEFEFESDSGFVLNQGNVLGLFINLNLPKMFTSVDFSKGTVDVNNVVVISEASNLDLYNRIKRNIRQAGEMHKDREHSKEKHD
jgi:hypothetical protein